MKQLNVQTFLDERRISPFQWVILCSCFLTNTVDMFDNAAMGLAAAGVAAELDVARASLGPVMSAALAGMFFGALAAGPTAEKTSPKWVLVVALLLTGLASFGCAQAQSLDHLLVLRFITGIGLGLVLPLAPMMAHEFAPARNGSLMINLTMIGGSLGGISCGLVAAAILPTGGWRALFMVGAVLPVLMAAWLAFVMPEPLAFMVQRGRAADKIRAVLKKLDRRWQAEGELEFVTSERDNPHAAKGGPALVLSKAYRAGTLSLWLLYFSALVIFYSIINWLPLLITTSGATPSEAALLSTLFTAGGILGALGLGAIMDRFQKDLLIAAAFLLGVGAILWMAQVTHDYRAVAVAIFVAGLGFHGALSSLPALASAFYPASARATGIAWMLGFGRLGGVLGPMLGGAMIHAGYGASTILTSLAVPAAVSMGAVPYKWSLRKAPLAVAPA